MRFAIRVLTGALAIAVLGCAGPPETSPAPTPVPAGFVGIPTLSGVPPSVDPGVLIGCGGVGFEDSILRGSATAAEPVWLEGAENPGKRIYNVRWPAGFWARFTPGLELMDRDGVVAKEGDLFTKVGGEMGSDGRLEIWDFNGRSYSCY